MNEWTKGPSLNCHFLLLSQLRFKYFFRSSISFVQVFLSTKYFFNHASVTPLNHHVVRCSEFVHHCPGCPWVHEFKCNPSTGSPALYTGNTYKFIWVDPSSHPCFGCFHLLDRFVCCFGCFHLLNRFVCCFGCFHLLDRFVWPFRLLFRNFNYVESEFHV